MNPCTHTHTHTDSRPINCGGARSRRTKGSYHTEKPRCINRWREQNIKSYSHTYLSFVKLLPLYFLFVTWSNVVCQFSSNFSFGSCNLVPQWRWENYWVLWDWLSAVICWQSFLFFKLCMTSLCPCLVFVFNLVQSRQIFFGKYKREMNHDGSK